MKMGSFTAGNLPLVPPIEIDALWSCSVICPLQFVAACLGHFWDDIAVFLTQALTGGTSAAAVTTCRMIVGRRILFLVWVAKLFWILVSNSQMGESRNERRIECEDGD